MLIAQFKGEYMEYYSNSKLTGNNSVTLAREDTQQQRQETEWRL